MTNPESIRLTLVFFSQLQMERMFFVLFCFLWSEIFGFQKKIKVADSHKILRPDLFC